MPMKVPSHTDRLRAAGRLPAKPVDHRPNAATRGYDADWQRLRDLFIQQHPLCALCSGPAVLVDHIQPISAGGARLDIANLRSLCRDCHAYITGNYRRFGINEPDVQKNRQRIHIANHLAHGNRQAVDSELRAGPQPTENPQ